MITVEAPELTVSGIGAVVEAGAGLEIAPSFAGEVATVLVFGTLQAPKPITTIADTAANHSQGDLRTD